MKQFAMLVATVAVVAVSPELRAAQDPCATAKSQLQINECVGAQAHNEEQRLAEYFAAARRRLSDDKKTLAALDKAQATWTSFLKEDCDAVYSNWEGGSIRNAKFSTCMRDGRRARTHDLWAQYLTYEDTTPPILPEPKAL